MKILSNKFFILGNLLLLLIAIPVTLFFVKKQQEVRSKAAASSKLYFNPSTTNTTTQCQNFTVDLMVDPGTNIVSIVDFYLTYDPTKLEITDVTPSSNFSSTVRAVSLTSGAANMSVSVGADVTKAVSQVSKVATVTFVPKAEGTSQVQIDSSKSRVFSLGPSDAPTENVLSTTEPGSVTTGTSACLTTSPTPVGGEAPVTTTSPAPTSATSPTPSVANLVPICSGITVSPSATGSAPFSVLITANGSDPDTSGLITKAAFNFGDGQTQDVTTGLNQKTVSPQASHTYQNPGTYGTTVVFTDNQNGASTACTQNITALAASGSGNTTPTVTIAPTNSPTPTSVLVAKPTAAPSIAPTGSISSTLGVIGAIVLTLLGGFILLAL